jgi:hypothetical protein
MSGHAMAPANPIHLQWTMPATLPSQAPALYRGMPLHKYPY